MESLNDEVWDVVLAGTSLPQSLLALALSRSRKKVIHVDQNEYYGGTDAGLSLRDADAWVEAVNNGSGRIFTDANIEVAQTEPTAASITQLGSPRSYTLALHAQIIYAQAKSLPFLISSRVHEQVDFVAVGSWWLLRDGGLQKIPSSREDVFADTSLSVRDKRGLNKFIRFAIQDQEGGDDDATQATTPADGCLRSEMSTRFGLGPNLELPLLALSLLQLPPDEARFEDVLAGVRRHIRSMNYFGPGFAAVTGKYGGNAEIAQVACRAGAVGGSTYLLGHGIKSVEIISDSNTTPNPSISATDEGCLRILLTDGTLLRTRHLIGDHDSLSAASSSWTQNSTEGVWVWFSISIISIALVHLFPQTAENGPVPAAAICLVESAGDDEIAKPPVYLQIHSEETGECPKGQCIVYGSTSDATESGRSRLHDGVHQLIRSKAEDNPPSVLWSLSYRMKCRGGKAGASSALQKELGGKVLTFGFPRHAIAFDDQIVDEVKAALVDVIGNSEDERVLNFLQFEPREVGEVE